MSMNVSVSGLVNAMDRQSVTANNVANINTAGYRARQAISTSDASGGVRMSEVNVSPALPGDAATAEFLQMSNVNLAKEQADSMMNIHMARANAGALRAQDDMLGEVLDLRA